nr:MAG TPA: hypothetical protein [Bacteriophage sp.]
MSLNSLLCSLQQHSCWVFTTLRCLSRCSCRHWSSCLKLIS